SQKGSDQKMKFLKSKKGLATLIASVVAVGAMAFGAYAYFTSTGSGSGSATVGATTNTIQISSETTGDLYPLYHAPAASNTVVTITNPSAANLSVHQVSLDPAFGGGTGITNDKEGDGCLNSWFRVDGSPVTIDGTMGPGGVYVDDDPLDQVTVWLFDNDQNQDACQGAHVTLHWVSN